MNKSLVRTPIICLLGLLGPAIHAAPPAAINLHGQLLGADGFAVSGDRVYQVMFYDAETAGNVLGSALTGTVAVSEDGLFNLAVTPPAAILTAGEVWYAIGVDTDEPADGDASDDVFPSRVRVYSVPFALQAQEVVGVDADRVGGGMVDNTEFDALDGVTGNIQAQLDAVDTTAIAQHTTDIAANAANIATNTSDIMTHAANIATNTSDIATNAGNISTNSTNIAANTTAIGTNTTNIAANAAALALKANTADVYTQSAADSAFVDASGDTMSGALGVDTLTEATADAGLTAEGVLLKDSYVGLAQITAPADTAGKLYNVSGNLFFGGTQLGLTNLDKDGINNSGTLGFDWLDSEVADALTIQGGSVNNDSFSALSDLTAESAIGSGAGQVAAGNHGHTLSALSGAVTDAQVPDTITINGGTVNNNAFSAISDLMAESAIGTGAGQVAAGNHGHTLSALSGAVTDGQVPDALTIQGGSVNNDSFSAISDLMAETAVGTGSSQVAAGNHAHAFSAITGSVTDAQVPDNITINRVSAADDSASAPSFAYASDPNTGMFRPSADQLALATGGSARLTVGNAETHFSGNTLQIASNTAPATTTNKLYNTGGNLFWNGTQLDTGGGDTDTLSWTAGYVYQDSVGEKILYRKTMTKAGTIARFEALISYVSGDPAVWTLDLRINGSSIVQGGAVTLGNNSVTTPTLSSTSFSQNDVLTIVANFNGSQIEVGSAAVTVEH